MASRFTSASFSLRFQHNESEASPDSPNPSFDEADAFDLSDGLTDQLPLYATQR